MNKNIKSKIITFVLCAGMMLSTMGMTALAAASGTTISDIYSGNKVVFQLKNKSGNTRRCVVTVRETTKSNYTNMSTVCTNGGNISSGNWIITNGELSKYYVKGYGYIYNSASDSSGIAKTIVTTIR